MAKGKRVSDKELYSEVYHDLDLWQTLFMIPRNFLHALQASLWESWRNGGLYKGIEIMVQTWTSKRSVMTFDLETLSRSQLILFLQSLCKLLAKVNKGVLMRSDMTLTSDLETIFKVRTLSKAFFRRKIGHWQGFHT